MTTLDCDMSEANVSHVTVSGLVLMGMLWFEIFRKRKASLTHDELMVINAAMTART